MRSVEILQANNSALKQLKTTNVTKLKIVDVSSTLISLFPIQRMPELQQLQIQESSIQNIDTRHNTQLVRISFGFGQVCSVSPGVLTYFNKILVPSSPVLADDNKLCTAKFYYYELVSLGIEYDVDIYDALLEFRGNK